MDRVFELYDHLKEEVIAVEEAAMAIQAGCCYLRWLQSHHWLALRCLQRLMLISGLKTPATKLSSVGCHALC